MNDAMSDYRVLEQRLVWMRRIHRGREGPEEEALLEEMTEVWWRLTVEEQQSIRGEGPKGSVGGEDGSRQAASDMGV